MRIRGVVFDGPGMPLTVEDLELADPGPGELLVRYTGSGVCRSDLHVVDGDWSRPTPVVLGHEGAGVVESVGAGVADRNVGDTVVLTWLAPCGRCVACRRGRSWLCSGSSSSSHLLPDGTARLTRSDGADVRQYLGLGTFAEAAVVPASAAVGVPAAVPAEVAALIGCAVATGWGAVVHTAAVQPGETVVVVGCGGVGLTAVMTAAAGGAAEVIAVDRMQDKLTSAAAVGATRGILAADGWTEQLAGTGVDVGLDCIGTPEVVAALAELVAAGGRVVLVGMTAQGVSVSVDGYAFPDRGLSLLGSCYGSTVAADDFPLIAREYLDGRLPLDALVDRRIGLGGLDEAFTAMRRGIGLGRSSTPRASPSSTSPLRVRNPGAFGPAVGREDSAGNRGVLGGGGLHGKARDTALLGRNWSQPAIQPGSAESDNPIWPHCAALIWPHPVRC